jgi:hypothetical protein
VSEITAEAEADTTEPGGSALQLTDAGLAAILDQFQASPLLSSGKVNVIGLDAISERMGDRWKVRRDLVHEHADNVLRRQLGPSSIVQRISATEIIVAQPDVSRFAGQVRCLNGLREIFRHFLGEARVIDLKVHEVTRITSTGVFGQRLDVTAIDAAEPEQVRAVSVLGGAEEPPPASLDRWTPFASSTGRQIGVSCSLEPLMQLKSSARIGYRVTRRVFQLPSHAPLLAQDLEALAPADLEKIDLATIARGIDRARVRDGQEKPPTLILPASFTTLHNRRIRPMVVALLEHARDAVRHGLIVEISGIDGAPAAALHEAISAVRPLCLHVIGRLSDGLDQDVRFLKGAGLDGLSVRSPPTDGDAQFVGWAKGFVVAATRIARALFVYDVAGIGRVKLAESLGVTHVTLAPERLKDHRMDDELPAGAFRGVPVDPG